MNEACRPIKAGNPDRPHVICSECLVPWPCRKVRDAAMAAAIRRQPVKTKP
jgi:hypothetical protein